MRDIRERKVEKKGRGERERERGVSFFLGFRGGEGFVKGVPSRRDMGWADEMWWDRLRGKS